MATAKLINGWTKMAADTEYVWCGGYGTFIAETAATFSSRPPQFTELTEFTDHTDISFTDAEGGTKNFILPRGAVIKSSAIAVVAPAGVGNDLRGGI